MALLLRRADEERIGSVARNRTGRRDARAIQGLVSHQDGVVSAAAMAVVLARGRRRDRFGQCLLGFDDLSDVTAERLVHAVAAALREDAAAAHSAAAADREISHAASALVDRHDRARSIEALTATLVAALDQSGTLGDELLLACSKEGEVGFLAEVVGRRAGIPADVALDELLSGNAARLVAVLRLAGSSREMCAGLLASLGDLLGIDDPGVAIAHFDAMSADDLKAAASWLAAPVTYRAALNALAGSNG